MRPVVTSFFTTDGYEEEARELEASAAPFDLELDLVALPPFPDWRAACRHKPRFLLEALDRHPGRALLWVDADARFRADPVLLDGLEADLAYHTVERLRSPPQVAAGTIYLANNDTVRGFLREWSGLCDVLDDVHGDQAAFARAIDAWRRWLRLAPLPPEYLWIFDLMPELYPGRAPVIEHLQASRRRRRGR